MMRLYADRLWYGDLRVSTTPEVSRQHEGTASAMDVFAKGVFLQSEAKEVKADEV